jgi:drug/metabolite transporter (DMT)-like permease
LRKVIALSQSSIQQRVHAPADTAHAGSPLPIAGLLIAATSWGVIWYPYRFMETAGLPVPIAAFFSYLVAVLFAVIVLRHTWREFSRYPVSLFLIGLTAGITNVAYLVAIMEAEVVRVVLLFYLAPLWTVPLARILIGERINRRGVATIAVAMTGAVVMLWHAASPQYTRVAGHVGRFFLCTLQCSGQEGKPRHAGGEVSGRFNRRGGGCAAGRVLTGRTTRRELGTGIGAVLVAAHHCGRCADRK